LSLSLSLSLSHLRSVSYDTLLSIHAQKSQTLIKKRMRTYRRNTGQYVKRYILSLTFSVALLQRLPPFRTFRTVSFSLSLFIPHLFFCSFNFFFSFFFALSFFFSDISIFPVYS